MNRLGSLSTRRIVTSFGRTSLSTTLGRSYINHPATTIIGSSFQQISVRSFSDGNLPGSSPSGENVVSDAVSTAASNVTETIQSVATDAAVAVTTAPDDINFVVRGVMDMIDSIHNFVGIPYWEAIVVTTIGLRVFLLPIAIKTVQGSSRMAVMRPAMQKLQDRMNSDPNIGDMNTKLRYQNEMKAMFLKYKVNPLRAVMWPFVQFPVFIALFLSLKEMGTVFPGFADGGAFWFQNLSAADPLYILPIFNSLSFLIMIEMGSDGVQMQQQQTFKMIMRGLAVGMVPVTISMPAGLFVYWGTNNVISIIQTQVLKNQGVRQFFDIPQPPKAEDTPTLKMRNPITAIKEAIENERTKGDNAKAEIIDGVSKPKAPVGPPPVTFSAPPQKKAAKK